MEFFSSYKMSIFPWRKTYWLYRGESVTFVAFEAWNFHYALYTW